MMPRRGSEGGIVRRSVAPIPGNAEAPAASADAVETGAGACEDQLAAGFSWTAQPLPSGSLKKAKEFHGPPWPSFHSPSSM
jgi:tetrahydromethanopterin S-methyltransferase subunit D